HADRLPHGRAHAGELSRGLQLGQCPVRRQRRDQHRRDLVGAGRVEWPRTLDPVPPAADGNGRLQADALSDGIIFTTKKGQQCCWPFFLWESLLMEEAYDRESRSIGSIFH